MDKQALLNNQLHQNLIKLIEDIDDMMLEYNLDRVDIGPIKFFLERMRPNDAMFHVIDKILPWKKQIQSRNELFFYKNDHIFGELPEDKVKYFAEVITNKISQDDKSVLWDYFDTFIAFAEEYKKNH